MNKMELECIQMITAVGNARSLYIEAIHEAKAGNFNAAKEKLKEGEKSFLEGHHIHADFLTREANGELEASSLLLIHSEDQLMSAEGFHIIAQEMIELYQMMKGER